MSTIPEASRKTWQKDNVTFYIVKNEWNHGLTGGHYCGYCQFAKRPVIEQDYNGILTYVPVHGGITYAKEQPDGSMIYGFDCAHWGDDNDARCISKEWLTAECERMALGIQVAAKYEERYLLARELADKAAIIDEMHAELDGLGSGYELSTGAILNLPAGDL